MSEEQVAKSGEMAAVFDGDLSAVEECTPELRWVPRSMLQAGDYVLQQRWRITFGRYRQISEWRDVPRVSTP